MIRISTLFAAGCVVALISPARVVAQEPASGSPIIRLGPLGLSPRVSLTNVGIDTNVLNQASDPQRDFTTTFVPGVDSWLQIGRGLVTSKSGLELAYFARVTSQRSVGIDEEGRFELAFDQWTPHASAGYVTTYRRPNAEIDLRVGQTTTSLGLGTKIRLGWRSSVDVGGERRRLELEDVQFQGVSLARALNRRVDTLNLNLNVVLTPLTTLVVKNSLEQNRFTFAADHDTDSVSVVPGLEFKPSALVSGSAFVGFRDLQVKGRTDSAFTGVVAAVALNYTMRDSTRFQVKVDRDLDYSFEPLEPFFLSSGGSLEVTQALSGRWDALGRIGQTRLDYRSSTLLPIDRRDQVSNYGTGVGYRLDHGVRVGFDVNYIRRRSPLESRRYTGFQFGGSVRYGF